MARRGRDPRSPEAREAVLERMRTMTKEEWQYWIDKLSHAPEGVYDPWSEENWPLEKQSRQSSNGAAPAVEPSPPKSHSATHLVEESPAKAPGER
jgi:hypothetical protein